jgi:copper chaperone
MEHQIKKTTLSVQGMTCNHCKQSVTDALENLSGVTGVEVDLEAGRATVEHEDSVDIDAMAGAIEDVGFDVQR